MEDKKTMEKTLEETKVTSLKAFQDNINIHERQLELLKEEKELKLELFEFTNNFPAVINPEYEYQTKSGFWDVVKKLNKNMSEKELIKLNMGIEQVQKVLDSTIEQRDALKGE